MNQEWCFEFTCALCFPHLDYGLIRMSKDFIMLNEGIDKSWCHWHGLEVVKLCWIVPILYNYISSQANKLR